MKTGLAVDRKSGTKFQNFIQVKVVPSPELERGRDSRSRISEISEKRRL
jgi:hypothetical protein